VTAKQAALNTIQTLLNDEIVETQFHLSSLDNTLLNGILRDHPKHAHLLLLSNTMGSVLHKTT
jgi:hypothetical protein